jgi:NAD(P)-dependent dehydrogenase (short-subunit alcohol dehydrogenase family)
MGDRSGALDAAQLAGMFRLDGKVALVAGGYGGIGEAVAWTLAAYGATVAVSGRSAERATALAGALSAAGHAAFAASFDILDIESIRRHADQAFDLVSDVNLKGAFFLAQAAGRHQIAAAGGRQIHLSSVRSLLGLRGRGYAAYCSTKGGLNLLVKQLAAEWAPRNILVNGVAPTFVRTEFVRAYLEDQAFYEALVSRIPLQRIAEPVDCAGAVLFLASPAAAFITGQILFVDGGITATQ